MYETTISLQAINDVKDFVNTVMLFNYDIDLVSGRYAVDAKSIMGIFSLDLSKPIKLQAHTEDPEALISPPEDPCSRFQAKAVFWKTDSMPFVFLPPCL